MNKHVYEIKINMYHSMYIILWNKNKYDIVYIKLK